MNDPILWCGLAGLSVVGLLCWIASKGEEYEDERLKRIERERERAKRDGDR